MVDKSLTYEALVEVVMRRVLDADFIAGWNEGAVAYSNTNDDD